MHKNHGSKKNGNKNMAPKNKMSFSMNNGLNNHQMKNNQKNQHQNWMNENNSLQSWSNSQSNSADKSNLLPKSQESISPNAKASWPQNRSKSSKGKRK